jgi:PAS domain S-box-containing protein
MRSKRSKLVIASGFAALIAIMLLVTLAGFLWFTSLNERVNQLTQDHFTKTTLLNTMRIAVRERGIELTLIANINDPFDQDEEMLRFIELGSGFADARSALLQLPLSDGERQLLEKQSRLTAEARPLHERLIELSLGGNFELAQRYLVQNVIPKQDEIVDIVKELQRLEDAEHHRLIRDATADFHSAYILLMALLGVGTIGFGAVITVLVARRIDTIETQLLTERERYALAVRGANDGLWDWDLLTNEVYFSPRWKDMLGYDDHEIDNRPDEWIKRIHPDDAEKTLAALTAHLNGLSYYFENEHRLQLKDGKYHWFLMRGLALRNENGKAHRIAGSVTDINERKRYEKHLHQNESRMRMVLDHVVDGIITTNDRGVVESMNSAAEEMFGCKSEDAVGHSFSRLLSEQHRHEYERHFMNYAESGSSEIVGANVRVRGRRQQGPNFPLSCTITEMQLGGERKLIVIAHDESHTRDRAQLSA